MSKFSDPYAPYKDTHRYSTPEFENLMAKLPVGGYNSEEKKFKNEEFENLLKDLQANILLSHRRNFSRFYFIHFKNDPAHLKNAIKWIKEISESGFITSAKKQFEQKEEKKPVCCFYLTWEGYRVLGLKHLAPVLDNKAFEQGMRKRVRVEFDQEPNKKLYPTVEGAPGEIHAMLMIASDKSDFSDIADRLQLSTVVGGGNDWAYVAIQNGLMKKRDFGLGEGKEKVVEWFGFRDGVSQPLFFPDAQGIDKFDGDSVAPLRIAFIRDRGGQHPYSAGSFLAFLKLEQDVQQFRKNVEKIAEKIPEKVTDEGSKKDLELAGAYIMGRFQDGTSVSLFDSPKNYKEKFPENDFQYSKIHISNGDSNESDEKSIRCPFASHARKANPRDDKDARYIVRRGVLYDDRVEAFKEENTKWKEEDTPEKEVGLLFMSFQSNLEEQFEYILNNWMLSVNTGAQATGVDMLAGTGFNRQFSRWYIPKKWGREDANEKELFTHEEIKECVKFKGGEYFFAPSISFLQKIESNSLVSNGIQGGFKIPVIIRK